MDQAQVALKLFLQALGVELKVATLDERVSMQKSVYLGQIAGVDLGYRFDWYEMGPFSPELARDYYSLAGALESGAGDEVDGYELREPARLKLAAVQPLLHRPTDVNLSDTAWLELVASVHFLSKQRRMDLVDVRATLRSEKTHVVDFMDEAVSALEDSGLQLA